MKGTFFQKPLEFNLTIPGESQGDRWKQGDSLQGELLVRNHGNEPLSLAAVGVHLAYGELKKVRQKSPEAFDLLKSEKFAPDSRLEPRQEARLPWKFQTDRNAPITDSSRSLFVLYGQGEATEGLGQLQLTVLPYSVIDDFLHTFTTDFRFVVKGMKFSKGRVEVKLAPPTAKAFAALEYVIASFRFTNEDLEVGYVFNVKKIEATAASVGVSKSKKAFEQVLGSQDYLTPSGRPRYEQIAIFIQEALQALEASGSE